MLWRTCHQRISGGGKENAWGAYIYTKGRHVHLGSFSKTDLLAALGPAPTIEATAKFLRENPMKVYRKLYSGQLERLSGLGVIKISLPSLLRYLNGGIVHVKNPPKNKRGRPRKADEVIK